MSILNKLRELWQYRELIRNLVRRNLKARYKNSILGIAWSWVNPLLMMLVFTVVFNNFLAGRSSLPNYHIFILCALLPWNFFSASVSGATDSIISNAHLVKKVYFPREVLPISIVLSNMVNFFMALPVFFVLALISGAPISPWALLLPIPLAIQLAFTIGICLLLATLDVFFRDTQIIIEVLLLAWFFVTPIFYAITDVPQTATILGIEFNAQLWLHRLNPMASIITAYRGLLYEGTPGALDFLWCTAITSLAMLIIGYLVFQHYSPRFSEEV